MNKIIESNELPLEEKVYLKKDFFGWRVVEPWKNPETGKINYFVLLTGGKKALAIFLFLMLLIGVGYLGYKEQIQNYKTVLDNPCSYCKDCQEQTRSFLNQYGNKYKINISVINFSIGGVQG